ncbi:MAG TPA: hypothetical protein VGK99_13390 [Acidobacteriota bacterium]|jgi:hypothetical protein
MTFEEFQSSLKSDKQPPEGLSPALQALWQEAKGDWDAAHNTAQDVAGADGAWVHAYLHRKEGDIGNARYWYARARKPEFQEDLIKEWEHIVTALLEKCKP